MPKIKSSLHSMLNPNARNNHFQKRSISTINYLGSPRLITDQYNQSHAHGSKDVSREVTFASVSRDPTKQSLARDDQSDRTLVLPNIKRPLIDLD